MDVHGGPSGRWSLVSALTLLLIFLGPFLVVAPTAVPALIQWPRPASQPHRGPGRPVVDWNRAVLA